MLELRNPHSILAVLGNRPGAVKSVRVQSLSKGDVWEQVVGAARELGIAVSTGSTDRRSGNSGRETERLGAGSAQVEPPSPVPLESLWQSTANELDSPRRDHRSAADSRGHGLWLALDQVQDPQNMGAIFRLAGFFGVRGILLTRDRSAPVNATVCDVAAGGVEFVPYSIVANLAQAMDKSRQKNIWTIGTCERATAAIHNISRDRHWMLVMGNEGQGMRRLTREKCDQLVGYPPLGPIPSLNVAAAAAACLAVLTSPGK